MTLKSLLQKDDIPEDVKGEIKLAIADQRKTEDDLIKTKTRLEYLLKSSPAVIYSCESWGNFQVTFMSENVQEITGYDIHEFIHNPTFWINGMHPDDRQQVVNNFEDIVQKEHYSETYRFQHKDGSYQWMLDEATLIRDEQGNPTEIVGYWTDITKQKEAEEKLSKSEEQYRSLFENIPIGLYRSTPDHKFLAANPTFIKQVGFSSFEELLSINSEKLATRRNYQRDRFLMEINAKGEAKGLESELKQSDGTSIYIRENARAIKDSKGLIICFEGSVEDITDRVLAEEALRESEEKYRSLIDNLSDIVIELDSEGNFSFISPQAVDVLGYIPEEEIGKSGFDFIHPDDMGEALELFQKALTGEQIYNFEYRAKHKKGHYVPVSVSGRIIEKDDEFKLISVLRDITERKKVEEDLVKTKTRLEYLLKSSPAVIYTCEPWGDFPATFMSENVKETTGFEVHEFVYNPSFWISGIHPDDRQRAVDNFKDIVQKKHYSKTYRFKHKNGSYHWMLDEATVILDEQGNPIETVGYWTDITERKEAEEALKESEEKFRLFFESAPISIATSSLDGYTFTMNQKTFEIMGYTEEELRTIDLKDTYVNPQKRNEVLQKLMSSGSLKDCEVKRRRKDGSEFIAVLNAQIIEKGGEKIILSTMQDITQQKIAEEKLQKSEQRFRTLFNESPISLWEEDFSEVKQYIENLILQGIRDLRDYLDNHPQEVIKLSNMVKIVDVNSETLKLYKINQKEDLLKSLSIVFGKESFSILKEEIIALAEGQTMFESEAINYTLTGDRMHVLLRMNVVLGFEKTLSKILVSIIDITKLRESEERLRAFMDSATDAFFLLDSELNIIEFNKNLVESWNLSEKEVIGKNITQLSDRIIFDANNEYTERLTQLTEVIQTKEEFDEEFFVIHPEHGEGYISVKAFKVGLGLGIIIRDITLQKQAELVRRELEQRRENFIYMTSHELRTPLTVISGYCDFLEKHDQFIDQERRDYIISMMKTNINRLERLTENVAQVAQIRKDYFQIFKREFDLCEFLTRNLDQYNQLLGDKFTFQRCLTEQSIIINADPDRLQQVLENVINNAIKHTSKDKGEITVKAELQGSNVQIGISDNGAGIAPEHLDTIFEQFVSYQTDYAAGGTGIGLYLSRKILEAHGGTISAQSAGQGHGSTFIIELPVI
ncbi:MAG: sensor histidine kinase [Candidatus Hodarchaeales archaeon]|jgi:PAS domain S-box-containing protein